jgi:hypothetical protein
MSSSSSLGRLPATGRTIERDQPRTCAPANRRPGRGRQHTGRLMAACSRNQPNAHRRFTNAGSRDNATRKRPSAHGANGDTRGSRQTRFAPDWRRAAAACKRDGASSTHLLQRQPAYCREQDYRAIAPSIQTTYVRALRKLPSHRAYEPALLSRVVLLLRTLIPPLALTTAGHRPGGRPHVQRAALRPREVR